MIAENEFKVVAFHIIIQPAQSTRGVFRGIGY